MNEATIRLILALLPVASRLIFDVGGKLIEINTAELSDPTKIRAALESARAEGFPQLRFVSTLEA